jgi:antitoxin (DNA-binding transcriptional repressor) of toxin-antitoxin stability system
VIARNGTPVVRLVPVKPPKRRLGRWRDQVSVLSDEQWLESDDAVAALFAKSLG